MKASNFNKLIQAITGRNFTLLATGENIELETKYWIERTLPVTGCKVGFYWTSPKSEEKILKTFITTFSTKYFEPNPLAYDHVYGGKQYYWNDKTEEQKEFAYCHHRSNMYNKKALLEQVEQNFASAEIHDVICRYGFYTTEYGIGTFIFYASNSVLEAVEKMKQYLNSKNIPFANELSDAHWVLRFKLGLSKEQHNAILAGF